jgi:hypothetical protein
MTFIINVSVITVLVITCKSTNAPGRSRGRFEQS